MAKKRTKYNPFELLHPVDAAKAREPDVHVYGAKNVVCKTNKRGHASPGGRSPIDLVVDATEGFVPLWAPGVTLRWRFQENSMKVFVNPDAAAGAIRELIGKAILKWGDAAPVRFAERQDAWDFEVVMSGVDDCDANGGCVLASAFFPDGGRHELIMYPKLFSQSEKEVIDTFIHEIGHVFGLRHFFALVSESAWPSEVFGEHKKFSIMNYGADSELTDEDREDLRLLYHGAWSGQIQDVNQTPVKLVKPYSSLTMGC